MPFTYLFFTGFNLAVEFVFDEQKVAEVNNQHFWVGFYEALRSFQSVLTVLNERDPVVR